MSAFESQLGVKREVAYGTDVVVDRFFEFFTEGVKPNIGRMEARTHRASSRSLQANRWRPVNRGAAGPIAMPIPSKGFAWWIEPSLGAVATSGPDANGRYTHAGTFASLKDKSFTAQVDKPFEDGTATPFTGRGGKVASWRISASLDQYARFEVATDFRAITTATALATAAYPTGAELMDLVGGEVAIAGTVIDVRDVAAGCDNSLKTDNYPANSLLKRQPLEQAHRMVDWGLGLFWDSMTQYNRVISDTRDGATAAIVLTFRAQTVIAGGVYPELVVTIPNARFDTDTPDVPESDLLQLPVTGVGLNTEGLNDAVSWSYKSVDATP